ncbi:MAG: tetratricopeptide repeat protein [Candidatus Helarchaeota archaeon]
MKEKNNFNLKAFLLGDEPKTFLVGAGCSIDPPSCLPSGHVMIEAIIKFSCARSEIDKLIQLTRSGNLRFEALVEIFRNTMDSHLNLIDFYGECNFPNLQHFFLAEMIKRGHFVITTNFDFLIERALYKSGVPRDEIRPVITKEDYQQYDDPLKLIEKSIKPIYKVHGSTQNISTGEDTRDSLIATLQAFGSNKQGFNIFQIEPFKLPVFKNISNGRSLIVIGYSGSDDFDLVPTLKALKDLRNILWLNHLEKNQESEYITEISADYSPSNDQFKKTNQILVDIKKINDHINVYRIDINVRTFIRKVFGPNSSISSINFIENPLTWIKNNFKPPNDLMKFYFPSKIFFDLSNFDDAKRCNENLLNLANQLEDLKWKIRALNELGIICQIEGNYDDALNHLVIALQITEQLGDLERKSATINNIAALYRTQGNLDDALKSFKESLEIDGKLGNQSSIAADFNNLGLVYSDLGNYKKALEYHNEAIRIDRELGDLSGISTDLNNIGLIFLEQGDYKEALKHFHRSLEIAEQLGDLMGRGNRLNNIGEVYRRQGNYIEAERYYREAHQIAEDIGDLHNKASRLNNIGEILRLKGNINEASSYYEKALKILSKIGLENSPIFRDIRKNYQSLNQII